MNFSIQCASNFPDVCVEETDKSTSQTVGKAGRPSNGQHVLSIAHPMRIQSVLTGAPVHAVHGRILYLAKNVVVWN